MDDYMSVSTYQDMALTTVKQLGQGHFGVVELCSHDNSSNSVPHRSELVAVKRFAKTTALDFQKLFSLRDNMRSVQNTSDFRNEFDIWREFDHKNIVKLLGLSLPSGRLVMEYIENGSLFSWLSQNRKQVIYFLNECARITITLHCRVRLYSLSTAIFIFLNFFNRFEHFSSIIVIASEIPCPSVPFLSNRRSYNRICSIN